ncbi:MAG: hypothetical protein QOE70_2430 [Chthoniobacter sp.]|jgi:hypothetical protein|nr:hypothetical protein [Chthoniobacter sp.]
MRSAPIRSQHRLGSLTLLIAALLACSFAGPAAGAEIHRVALSSFTTDENAWDSITATMDLTLVLQTELAKEPGIEWVERMELGLARQELELDAAAGRPKFLRELRLARWNKADWMLTGHIASKDGVRELRAEVIDLAHADVLAERRVPIAAGKSLRVALGQSRAIGEALREGLRAAAQREREVAGLPAVAVLFFPNSEVFQREFSAALADPKQAGGSLRLLRFPRAGEASDESGLVAGGFAEDPGSSWRSVADVYLWGSLVPRRSGDIDGEAVWDAHTPEITLTVWDGTLSPVRFIEEGEPLARRDFDQAVGAQAHRLAATLVRYARGAKGGAVDEAERRLVSRALFRVAEEMVDAKTSEEGSLQQPEGRRFFLNLVQTLEVACFFDPQNRAAHEALLRRRWDRLLEQSVRNRFTFHVGRSDAWARFVERFGVAAPGPTLDEQMRALTRERPIDHQKYQALQKKRSRAGLPVAQEFVSSACEVAHDASLGNATEFGLAREVPEEIVARWKDEFRREVARRALVAAGEKEADLVGALATAFEALGPNHFYLRDPRFRLDFLESLWPHLSPLDQARVAASKFDMRRNIEWTFAALGRAGQEQSLFAAIPPLPERGPVPAREDLSREAESGRLFRMFPIIVPLPEAEVPVEKFEALEKAGLTSVHDLALLGGRVWLIGEGTEQTEMEGTNRALAADLLPTETTATRLFSFDPASKTLEREAATRLFKPNSLLAHEGKLWLTLGRDGVAVLDPATGALRRFGPEEGLNVASAYRLAAAGGRIFAAVNTVELAAWDPATERWSMQRAEFPNSRNGFHEGAMRRIQGLGSSLLLAQGALGVADVNSRAWTRFDAVTAHDHITCVAAEPRGYWLGGVAGLHFLDPQTGATVHRFCRVNADSIRPSTTAALEVEALLKGRALLHAGRANWPAALHPLLPSSRLCGPVKALAPDGDYLWVASMHPASNGKRSGTCVTLLHKPTGRWVTHFRTDAAASLSVDERSLWLGCELSFGNPSKCLQRLEKRLLHERPADQWTPDALTESETDEQLKRLDIREQALWHFTGGAYAKAAALLGQIAPPTPESLFLQGLCYDATGLAEPEKSRAFFRELITAHPEDPLANEARKQLGEPASSAAP